MTRSAGGAGLPPSQGSATKTSGSAQPRPQVSTRRSPRNETNLCHRPRLLPAHTWIISWPAWSPRHLEQRARPAQVVQKKLQQPALLVERHASGWSEHFSKKFVSRSRRSHAGGERCASRSAICFRPVMVRCRSLDRIENKRQ